MLARIDDGNDCCRLPGAGEEDAISSSSSRNLLRRDVFVGPLLAADMLGRSGELEEFRSASNIQRFPRVCRAIAHLMVYANEIYCQRGGRKQSRVSPPFALTF